MAILDNIKDFIFNFIDDIRNDKKKLIMVGLILLIIVALLCSSVFSKIGPSYSILEIFDKSNEISSGTFSLKIASVTDTDGSSYTQPTYTISGTTDGKQTLLTLTHEYNSVVSEFKDFMFVTDDAVYVNYRTAVEMLNKIYNYKAIDASKCPDKWLKADTTKGSHDVSALLSEGKTALISTFKPLAEAAAFEKIDGGYLLTVTDGAGLSELLYQIAKATETNETAWNALMDKTLTTGNSLVAAGDDVDQLFIKLMNTIIPGEVVEEMTAVPEEKVTETVSGKETVSETTSTEVVSEEPSALNQNTVEDGTSASANVEEKVITENIAETKVGEKNKVSEESSEKVAEETTVVNVEQPTGDTLKSNMANTKADVAVSYIISNMKKYAESIKNDGNCSLTFNLSCAGSKRAPVLSTALNTRYAIESGYKTLSIDFTFAQSDVALQAPEANVVLTSSESKVAITEIFNGLLIVQSNETSKEYEEDHIPEYSIAIENEDTVICKSGSDMIQETVVYKTSAGSVFEVIATITSTDKTLYNAKINYYETLGFKLTSSDDAYFSSNGAAPYAKATLTATNEYMQTIRQQATDIDSLAKMLEN